MALLPGARIGAFEIVDTLGAGGMGEVYRARDTRLHREVAIKVLPVDVAGDPERLARFEREARTLAALNHPGIAHIHGLEGGATQAMPAMLIMELVEGEDLSARIARGPLPVDEALAVARQIADALDAAHMAGIVHRDLKPANIKLRADGSIKLLDFGLAKAVEGAVAAGRPGETRSASFESPTITSPALTMGGVILGTAAYMSPEQARGKPVDKRADIWAFGCVLFEMLTGRPAFDGDTVTDVLGAIVRSEPDWLALPVETPARTRELLQRCLQKDASKRLRDIGDASAELNAIDVVPSSAPATASVSAHRTRAPMLWTAALVLIAGAAGAIGYFARPAARADAPLVKSYVAIQQEGGVIRQPVISPDGRRIAYVGSSRIWVQSLDEWTPRELPGTEAAVRPFWSPAGDWIGYFRSEALLKVPAAGGPVVRIATLPAVQAPLGANSAVWDENGTIILSLASGPPLRVPSGGGNAVPFVTIPADIAIDLHDLEWLPNGALLATAHRAGVVLPNAIAVLKDNALRVVLEVSNVRHPSYAPPGYLVFERLPAPSGESTLWAVPFSLDRLEVTGEPFLIGAGAEPSVARDGTLSFAAVADNMPRQLSWFTLDGRVGARLAEPRDWVEGVSISRDGRRVLASATDGIWMYDTDTGARSRTTSGSADITPNWVDANSFVFVRTETGGTATSDVDAASGYGSELLLVMKRIGGEERVLAPRARFPRVTADGRRIVFNIRMEQQPGWEVAWIDLDRPSDIHRLGRDHAGARFPSVSPDGTLVTYVSGEVGRDEIFVTRLPSGEGKWQVSTNGGGWTLFSPRGDAVIYRAPDAALMSVAIATDGKDIKLSPPQKLFDWGAAWMPFYDLAADGKRGVAAMPVGKATDLQRLSIVQNWHREFLRR